MIGGLVRRVVSIVAMVVPAALQSQSFEGAITVHVSGGGRNAGTGQDMEYLSRGGKVRVTMAMPAGTVVLLGLPTQGKSYLLMESQRTYMELPGADDAPSPIASTTTKTVRTGKKETIAGYECEHVIVETMSASTTLRTDVCMSSQLGPFLNPAAGGTSGMGGRMAPWQQQMVNESGFPLKVTQSDGSVVLLVTKVEKRRVSDALFRIPPEYNKMDMPKRPPTR